jgi:large subunit ribosomal protein L28
MARICAITGKRPVKGSIINRKGQSKKSGGIGTHTTSTKRVWVAVKALKAGLVTKA